LKEERVWQHRFGSISHARDVIGRWMRHYNTEASLRILNISLSLNLGFFIVELPRYVENSTSKHD